MGTAREGKAEVVSPNTRANGNKGGDRAPEGISKGQSYARNHQQAATGLKQITGGETRRSVSQKKTPVNKTDSII